MKKISKRLLCCAEQVMSGARVADIGADHGYLGIYLISSGKASFVHASELRERPLASAIKNAARYGVTNAMRFSCDSGLRAIDPHGVDTIVCAGMGGDLIAQILFECTWIHDARYQLILQPQASGNDLRRKLSEDGFGMERETLVEDGGFVYNVMCVRHGCAAALTPGQQYLSPQLLQSRSPLLPRYKERIVRALTRTVEGLERANDLGAKNRLAYYKTALDEVLEMEETP